MIAGHPMKGGPKAHNPSEVTFKVPGKVYGKWLVGAHPKDGGQKSVMDLEPPPLEATGKKIVGV